MAAIYQRNVGINWLDPRLFVKDYGKAIDKFGEGMASVMMGAQATMETKAMLAKFNSGKDAGSTPSVKTPPSITPGSDDRWSDTGDDSDHEAINSWPSALRGSL